MRMRGCMGVLALLGACGAAAAAAAPALPAFVDIRGGVPVPQQVAVLACAGLQNREGAGGDGVYVVRNADDVAWMAKLMGITPDDVDLAAPGDFIAACAGGATSVAEGVIVYDYATQRELLPQLITVAGVEDAVPVDAAMYATFATPPRVLLDATSAWRGFNSRAATQTIRDKYINSTTSLAFMDPGYDDTKPADGKLVREPDVGLTDYIVKARLFNMYMPNQCIPLMKDHKLMEEIATENPWPRPVPVYGYNSAWQIGGGDTFEAETNCVGAHNLGEIATSGTNNLAYFSRKPAIATPLVQNAPEPEVFNTSRTYVSLVVGDGDNVNFMKGSRRQWMDDRVARCAAGDCFPLLWTASPQLLHLAPDMLRWYYTQARTTGADYFMLPPSGDLYSYPGEMPADVQAAHVRNTQRDCELMSTSMSVHWEFFGTWDAALKNYFPQHAGGSCEGFVTVNVPYMIPITAFKADEYYKVIAERVVVFRPREWRGTSGSDPLSGRNYLTPEAFAAEVNAYPPGTVTSIYVTSDGGAGLGDIYALAAALGEHVRLVSHTNAVDFARRAHSMKEH